MLVALIRCMLGFAGGMTQYHYLDSFFKWSAKHACSVC